MKELGREEIISRYSFLFEHRPWIVEAAADRAPFKDTAEFHGTLMWVVEHAPEAAQLDLLRAHPKLADKAQIRAGLTRESASEQASAGLDSLTEDEYARFHDLNAAYDAKFGFPFIICVRLAGGKAGILAAMQARLQRAPEDELKTALEQVGEIVRLRLEDVTGGAA